MVSQFLILLFLKISQAVFSYFNFKNYTVAILKTLLYKILVK